MEGLISNFLFPLSVAVVSYILLNKLDEWRKRKDQSILGTVIIDSLIEEIKIGYDIINTTLTSNNFHPGVPPRKSWTSMNTVPDEVLLRIIAVSKNTKARSFPPKEIRTHCKNYFDHLLPMWDTLYDPKILNPQQQARSNFVYCGEAAKSVLVMLEQTKKMLDDNSKKWIPV